ncbi:MAG: hypothetical protein C0621_11115 [Desulfuromonas sp.]|nr:MAG: hypothetical protein C0621_11115 [Desulfuromonas sp.]
MKKILILTIAAALFATPALAATTFNVDDGSGVTLGSSETMNVKLSKNVKMGYAAATAGLGYVIGAFHTSGTRTFASSSGDAKIFFTNTTGADLPAAPTGTASAGFSWDAL